MTTPGQAASNKEIVRRLYGYIQDNRTTEFASVVSAMHTDHSNGRNGPSGFIVAAENLHKAYSSFEIELTSVIADGDLVVVQWRESGVHTGPFFNLLPTHKPFEAAGLNMYRVVDGMIVDSWIAVDPRTIRAQQVAQRALRDDEVGNRAQLP